MKSVEIDVSKLAKQVADDLKEYSEETAKIVDSCRRPVRRKAESHITTSHRQVCRKLES